MRKMNLKVGSVVQLSAEGANKAFAGCLMVVTDPKPWGAQGYVQNTGESRSCAGLLAFYRAEWAEMEYVGEATWVAG